MMKQKWITILLFAVIASAVNALKLSFKKEEMFKYIFYLATSLLLFSCVSHFNRPSYGNTDKSSTMMYYTDSSRVTNFAKDPYVVFFKGRYLMYYSVKSYTDANGEKHGLGISVAESTDLKTWKRISDISTDPSATYESRGIGAPSALVIDGKVHLFYQTYGNREKDAICHAWSDDGLTFTRNATNPIFRPDGAWNIGRAIDVEVIRFKDNYWLYFATRDPTYEIQMLGVARAPSRTNFDRGDWEHISVNGSILKPELSWEKKCIEAPSVVEKDGKLYMFYAGAYNSEPQQIGVAVSSDGINWKRLFDQPFLTNGAPGTWNSDESGHPDIFKDTDGRTLLFYQGNNNSGKTWYISNKEVFWKDGTPSFEH